MRGEWIEIGGFFWHMDGRIPSLPMRGEWIEISYFRRADLARSCLSPCGESGLKLHRQMDTGTRTAGLSPCGESGLKSEPLVDGG